MTDSNSYAAVDSYSLLRTALAAFKKTPNELSDEQRAALAIQARNEHDLELRVLTSPEAASVIVTEEMLDDAVNEIRSRFDDEDSFIATLEQNNLDLKSLKHALLRQCKVENVLEIVGSHSAHISDVEVGIFYHMHPEKFHSPEQRNVSHILITINDDYAENSRDKALERINEIALKLQKTPYKFAEQAMQHSECPSALQGGELGAFPKGKLYPEIDEVLFSMKKGEISDVVETEVGFHLVICNKIMHAESISLKKAKPQILKLMQDRAKRNCQRSWLASLPAKTTHTITN